MYRGYKISVYMPCRNEAQNLPYLSKRIPKFVDQVVVISNRSTDNTVQVAQELGMDIIEDNRAERSIGYGFAHQSGIKACNGDIIISIDGDGQHPIEDIDKIIDHLLENKLDFISCNRFPPHKSAYASFKQWLGVKILNLEVLLLFGINLNDTLTGMWVFNKEASKLLTLESGDWNLSPEIKIKAARNKEIAFSEFSIFQYKRNFGKTHQQHFRTGLSHLIWIANFRLKLFKKQLTNFFNSNFHVQN